MTERRPPAGWYDDPAGGGGRRYWNGSVWTDRVEGGRTAAPAAAPSGARGRIPEGYMLLNGQQVPIRGSLPHQPRTRMRGFVVAALVVAAAAVLLFAMSAVAPTMSEQTPVEVETFEVDDFEDFEDLDDLDW